MATIQNSEHAALSSLIVLQVVMLGSLYAGVAPHPPAATPLFGIAPFLGASISLCLAAMVLRKEASLSGRILVLLAALAALVSFGPQKYLDPNFALIWPAVVGGQVSVAVLIWSLLRERRARTHV